MPLKIFETEVFGLWALLQLGSIKIGKREENIFIEIQTSDFDFTKLDPLTTTLWNPVTLGGNLKVFYHCIQDQLKNWSKFAFLQIWDNAIPLTVKVPFLNMFTKEKQSISFLWWPYLEIAALRICISPKYILSRNIVDENWESKKEQNGKVWKH